jgi:hypothetical protein
MTGGPRRLTQADRDVVEVGECDHDVRLPSSFPDGDLEGVLLGADVERDSTDEVSDAWCERARGVGASILENVSRLSRIRHSEGYESRWPGSIRQPIQIDRDDIGHPDFGDQII